MNVFELQQQYISLKQHILTIAVEFLKSFSIVDLGEISNQMIQACPITLEETEKQMMNQSLVKHFNDWCVKRKEAETKDEIETLEDSFLINQKEMSSKEEEIAFVEALKQMSLNLQAYICELYQPDHTTAYNDFVSRSTEEIITYFNEHERMEFYELNRFKKEIKKLLNSYLKKIDASYETIYKQYFFKLDHDIDIYLNGDTKEITGKKTTKKRVKQKK